MSLLDRFKTGRHFRTLRRAATASPESLREAQDALREIGAPALPGLFEALDDAGARDAARHVLESLLSDRTLDVYIEALATAERGRQREIATLLGESRRYDARAVLPALSRSDIPNHRVEAILRAREDLPADALLEVLPDLEREARTIAARLLEERVGSGSVTRIAKLARSDDWWLRHQAAGLLGKIPGEASEECLIRLLKDPNKSVRLRTVQALRALEAKPAVPALAATLRDADLTVQAAAIDALITIGDAKAVPALVEVLQDESEQSRRAAVEVLNAVATEEAIQDLVLALRDADWWVRVRAADALGTLGGQPVVDAVLGLMSDPDVHLRRYAVEILNTVPDGRSVQPLIEALGDDDWWVRERSIDALSRSGDERAVEPLIALLAQDDQAAPLCARALGALGYADAVEPLLAVLASSPPDEVEREVREALRLFARGEVPAEIRPRLEAALHGEGCRVEKTRLRPMAVRAGAAAPASAGPEAAPPSGSGAIGPPLSDSDSRIWKASTVQAAPPAPAPVAARPAASSPAPGPRPLRPEDIEPGMTLLERYQVLSRIGRGGFATVFLAADRVISENVILKILSPHLSSDERMAQRFVQELKIARRISHPNVIRIHDLLEIGEARAISMEFFEGRDLGKILDEAERLPADRVLHIALQVADGLGAAHDAGVIHRDVKPGNILVGAEDEVKLLDFGLASATQELGPRLTRTGHLVGTPHYMAPELIRGEDADGRADIYSFGIVLYEMLAGCVPYDGDNPMNILFRHLDGDAIPLPEIRPDLPDVVHRLVGSAMATDPALRPADARALAEEITAAAGDAT